MSRLPDDDARTDATAYCAEQVRRLDHDRYLTTLFAPPLARDALWALYAFNLELGRVRETVSEPLLGEIRLQFWRDVLAEIFEAEPRPHLVALALRDAVRRFALPRQHLERLVDARSFDLGSEAPAHVDALEAYAEATSGTLVHLALSICGFDDETTRPLARDIGIAWALSGLLRAQPFLAAQGRVMLPRDWLAEAGLTPEHIARGQAGEALRSVVARVAARAESRLAAARALAPRLPKRARPALLVGVLAARDLRRLRGVAYDTGDGRLRPQPLRRLLALAWSAWRGRY